MPEAERAHAGGVDDPSAGRHAQRHRRRRGVPPAAGDRVDDADRAIRARHERVDQGRLADARVPDRHGGVPGERRGELVERPVLDALGALRAAEHRDVEAGEVRQELVRIAQVGLRDDHQRRDPGVVRGDQVAVDEPRARLGVGGRDHDHQLVGVGDDDPLDLVGVVGAAAQQGGARRIRTMRASEPSSPLVSPTRSTRSPVTIAWSRSSRARVVVSTRSSAPSSSASTV